MAEPKKNRERPNHMVYYRSPYSQATIVGCTMCPILRHTRLPKTTIKGSETKPPPFKLFWSAWWQTAPQQKSFPQNLFWLQERSQLWSNGRPSVTWAKWCPTKSQTLAAVGGTPGAECVDFLAKFTGAIFYVLYCSGTAPTHPEGLAIGYGMICVHAVLGPEVSRKSWL